MPAEFDVFLSHNSRDKVAVRQVADWLEAKGLRVWFDEWELRPGLRWQEGLEDGIESSASGAVFLGEAGFGDWQTPEARAFLARKPSLLAALRWVDDAFVGDPQDVRSWPTLDPLAPHAGAVVAFADQAEITDPTTRLMNQLAGLYHFRALSSLAEPLLRRALAIKEKSFGAEHPEVATGLNNLAQLLESTNRLAEAEPLMRRALAIDEKSLGAEHPDVARDLNNLARLLQATNRLAEAEPLMRRAWEITVNCQARTGFEYPSLSVQRENYRLLLMEMGRSESEIEASLGAMEAPES
jgi:tetratricopeptide (TPR) repeat protein